MRQCLSSLLHTPHSPLPVLRHARAAQRCPELNHAHTQTTTLAINQELGCLIQRMLVPMHAAEALHILRAERFCLDLKV